MNKLILTLALLVTPLLAFSQNKTVAQELARIEKDFGVSFVYEGDLVEEVAYEGPALVGKTLAQSLELLFKDTEIAFSRHGSYIVLTRKKKALPMDGGIFDRELSASLVTDRMEASVGATGLGVMEIPKAVIMNVPVLFGEQDVLHTIELMPGVQRGAGSFSGFSVRGGEEGGNLMLLDGIPVYNARHALGIFSVFPPDAVESARFYKGSFPARFGGRNASVLDVVTADGSRDRLRGSYTLGLISDKAHLEGPLGKKSTFSLSGRMVHTGFAEPLFRAFNVPANYYFYDLHGKLTYHAGPSDRLSVSVYHGRDFFRETSIEKYYNHFYDKNYAAYDRWITSSSEERIRWGNTLASVAWTHVFSDKLFMRATAAYSLYSMKQVSESSNEEKLDTDTSSDADTEVSTPFIRSLPARVDFTWTPSSSHQLKFGIEAIRHLFLPDRYEHRRVETEGGEIKLDAIMEREYGNPSSAWETAVYAEDEFLLAPGLSLHPGGRFSAVMTWQTPFFCFEPRLALRWEFRPGFAFKAGYSRMSQAIHQLSSGSVSLPTDVWVPITGTLKPELSDQLAIGLFVDALPGWRFSVEPYAKWMQNVLEYRYSMPLQREVAAWESNMAQGVGRAAGIEFLAEKTEGKLSGWASYTLSFSERRFPDGSVNQGQWYPYVNDRRHNFTIYANWKFSERADMGASWVISSGNRFTLPEYYGRVVSSDTYESIEMLADSRNKYQLPPTHRLDLTFNLRKELRRGERIWSLGLYNAYFALNPDQVYLYQYSSFNHSNDKGQRYPEGHIGVKVLSFLTIIPSVSYTRQF